MAESARKVAEEAEHRLDNLAEDVRQRFDRISGGRFSDQVKAGRFSGRGDSGGPSRSGQVGQGAGRARSDQHRRQRGGSAR
ncbi:hypothetical protein SAMN05443287_107277 [Micromonospora phaseoli]|uniref:Uncharacterized protein n=1 Tax=Micromonospora phaseoli TaxID=1144548 RepID=A0A1H7BJ94_9ACTN|nr:hypothetical protein [Micromonospora phaseoli]PZV94951.1 hypothetical protein CLV64_10886 [Micromonospora phaseoli]GIJ79905.1 hypothetical protein Xph01_43370 [Micromonospora phaseoli]SEJ76974.1 hypothetical protein SAMN05443287_107277 [Micromonospora phaseoli]